MTSDLKGAVEWGIIECKSLEKPMYHIQLEQFEGPLDLLLSLIEKQQLDITRLSLAQVTDQYLEYIAAEGHISLENLAWFLLIASRLILIKSKALLPLLTFEDDEEEEIADLEWQLKEYRKFKTAALVLKGLAETGRRAYARESYWGMQAVFYPPRALASADVRAAFLNVLGGIPVFEKLEERMMEEVMTLEEKIVALESALRARVEASFADIVAQAVDRIDVIVSFLAMLELVKQRVIAVDQVALFSEIRLRVQ